MESKVAESPVIQFFRSKQMAESGAQIRNACITWNNPPVEKVGPFAEGLPKEIRYLVWSLECGKAGNIHWQMYAEFNRPMTIGGIKKMFGDKTIHIERRRGTAKEAADYCKKKDDTHLAGPWELGEISHQGVDMEARQEREEQIAVIGRVRRGEAHLQDVPEHQPYSLSISAVSLIVSA